MKKGLLIPLFRLMLIAVIVFLVIFVLTGFSKVNETKKENEKLNNVVSEIKARNNEIKELSEAGSREIMERYAKDKLGFGERGERVYYDISGK